MKRAREEKGTLFAHFGGRPRTTGRGTRPRLIPHREFATGAFADPHAFDEQPGHDANQRRLLAAIRNNQAAYRDTPERDYETRAGFVNEAREFHAVLTKYERMTPEERADRVYLPQMNIYREGRPAEFRRPDLIKLKRKRGEAGTEYHASAIEFKSSQHKPDQRQHTMGLLRDQDHLRASFELPWEASTEYHFDLPVTKYKTRFAGGDPHMHEPDATSHLVDRGGRDPVIRGTHVKVTNKQDP